MDGLDNHHQMFHIYRVVSPDPQEHADSITAAAEASVATSSLTHPVLLDLDAMHRILSAEGHEGLRAFLNSLPTERIEALLVASEITGSGGSSLSFDGLAWAYASMMMPPSMQYQHQQHHHEVDDGSSGRRADDSLDSTYGHSNSRSSTTAAHNANGDGLDSFRLPALRLPEQHRRPVAPPREEAAAPGRPGLRRQGVRKFERVASEGTRNVLASARGEPSAFVEQWDFPTTGDLDFLLFHQTGPVRRPEAADRLRRTAGLCCKHCVASRLAAGDRDSGEGPESGRRGGVYFPSDVASLADSTFAQTLWHHMMVCPDVPGEIRAALEELKRLDAEWGLRTRLGGSRKRFIKKIWGRMERHYENNE